MNILGAIGDLIVKSIEWVVSWFGEDPRVEEIRQRVVMMCGFLPTASSVAAMLSASNPMITGVIGIATAICQAVSRNTQSLISSGYGTVNGVPIEGDFVEKP